MSTAVAPILYVGLDVHKDSITIAVLPSGAEKPTHIDRVAHDLKVVRRYLERLGPADSLRACYEASGAGYVLERAMRTWGMACAIIAPSLIPQRAGHQRKHDRYDASQLARLYRGGQLTPIRIPTEADERVRDLVRCRTTFQREVLRARHYVTTFLTRRGLRFTAGKCHWTRVHRAWLATLVPTGQLVDEDAVIWQEYLSLLAFTEQRRDALDTQIETLALRPALAAQVTRLRAFRGIDTQAAMVLATELVDWGRFARPTQLMAFGGLVPREDSSGERHRTGAITKAGNSYCRHVLIQAAWAYRHPPRVGRALAERQRGVPADVILHSWKAQQRLHKLFTRVSARKGANIAVVAVARELVGFLWAVLHDHPVDGVDATLATTTPAEAAA